MTIPSGSADQGTNARPRSIPGTSRANRSRLILGASLAAGLLVLAGILIFVVLWLRSPGIDQYLSDLKSTDPDTRAQAVVALADTTPQDRSRAAVTAALEPLLFEGDPYEKIHPDILLRAYLHWADQNNVPALIRMVDHPTLPSWDTRKTALAMQTLGKLQDPRGVEVLVQQLPHPELHDDAVSALKLLGSQAERAVLVYLFDGDEATRQRANELLAAYHTSPATITAVALDRLQSGSPEVQRGAASWFADNPPANDFQKADVAPLLVKLLDKLDPRDNRLALRALQHWSTRDSLKSVVAFAHRQVKVPASSKAAENNSLLIDVLARFQDASAAEAMAPLLRDPTLRDKVSQALRVLGQVSVEAVLPYLDHPDPEVGREARRLCRDLGISEGRQIEQCLADIADPRNVRSRTALQHLASLRRDEAFRQKVSQALEAPLLDPDRGIREEAARAAAVWATKQNADTLAKLLGDFRGRSKEDYAYRDRVCQALITIGPEAENKVISLLQSEDRTIRGPACRILAEVGTLESTKPLQAAALQYASDRDFSNDAEAAITKIMARK
jgi:hypothetical protein